MPQDCVDIASCSKNPSVLVLETRRRQDFAVHISLISSCDTGSCTDLHYGQTWSLSSFKLLTSLDHCEGYGRQNSIGREM